MDATNNRGLISPAPFFHRTPTFDASAFADYVNSPDDDEDMVISPEKKSPEKKKSEEPQNKNLPDRNIVHVKLKLPVPTPWPNLPAPARPAPNPKYGPITKQPPL